MRLHGMRPISATGRAIQQQLGATRSISPYFNLGVVELMRDDFSRARPYLEEALRRAEIEDRPGRLALTRSGMVACTAGLGRFDRFDDYIDGVEEQLARTSMAGSSIPEASEIAAEQALAAEQLDRTHRALELALHRWRQFSDEEAVERVHLGGELFEWPAPCRDLPRNTRRREFRRPQT